MQQTFFICGFSPLYSGFLRSSSFLSSSSLCERLKIMKYDLFFSFSDLYPSVSPSWLSSVEKRASRLSLNPRLPEPRERIRLINSTSSSHFLTLWGDQQINSTSKNRVNPSTTRKVDARHFKSFPMRVRNGSFESAYFIRIGLIRITHSVLLMKLTHIIWVIWLISNES